MNVVIGTSSALVILEVGGTEESVKICVEKGIEISGRETPTKIFGGSGAMVIGIVLVIGEDGGVFIKEKSENRLEDLGGVDTFRIGVVVGGSEVAALSSISFQTETS